MVLSACEVDDQSGGNNSEIATVGGLELAPIGEMDRREERGTVCDTGRDVVDAF
ncbi:hypothetical protein BH20CHL2_BH20CHL2_00840 [soil metagenome]